MYPDYMVQYFGPNGQIHVYKGFHKFEIISSKLYEICDKYYNVVLTMVFSTNIPLLFKESLKH